MTSPADFSRLPHKLSLHYDFQASVNFLPSKRAPWGLLPGDDVRAGGQPPVISPVQVQLHRRGSERWMVTISIVSFSIGPHVRIGAPLSITVSQMSTHTSSNSTKQALLPTGSTCTVKMDRFRTSLHVPHC